MRRLRFLMVLLACACPVWPAAEPGGIPLTEYADRRLALKKALPDSTIVLFGATEAETGDLRTGFFQEPNFYYLTGWREPGAALLLTPGGDTLFLPPLQPDSGKWTGPKGGPGDADIAQRSGFATVRPLFALEAAVREASATTAHVHTVKAHPQAASVQALLPLRQVQDATITVARLRMKKSATELALLQRAIDVTIAAHRAGWQATAPGKHEYEVEAALAGLWVGRGCERAAYAPIVGSGPNATVLHYSANRRRMDAGELLLVDAGAECAMYAADVTRTVPVSGRFTPRQRELYDIVLGAQKAAIAAVKPGMTLRKTGPNSLYMVAMEHFNAHGKDRQGQSLGRYFTHGLGHHVGLDVHDANDPDKPLEAGMVITIEPGLYLPEEGIGVRIEDMVLVTESGAKVLSEALPRDADAMERSTRK